MRRATTLTISLLCFVVLAACAGDKPDPAITGSTPRPAASTAIASSTPSPEQSPTPTVSVSPTSGPDQDVTRAPEPPGALTGPGSKENAAAVATYFMKLFPYAVATGDLAAWNKLSGNTCNYCSTVREIVEDIYADGNHGIRGALDITGSEAYLNDDGSFVVILGVTQHPSQTVDSTGSLVEDFPETNRYRPLLGLQFQGGAWTVTGVQMDKAT